MKENNHNNNRMRMRFRRSPEVQLNLNVRGLSPSATVSINERSNRLRREGRKIYKLGLGQSPFPVPELVVKALQENAYQKDYLPVKGLFELRQAIADQHSRVFGIETWEDDVLIGPGSKELMFILQLVYYGDLVIPTPAWVSYAPQARIIGRQIHMLPTKLENGWRLTPGQLDNLCRSDPGRPRIVVLNYPSNPTGTTYNLNELRHLAHVARKYHVVLLSDEIYGRLHHRGRHHSIVQFYPEGTILSGGLSKWCGAGGWRLGMFVFPKGLRWLLDAMAVVASETFTSTSAPIQYAAIAAFQESPELELYLAHSQRVLRYLGKKLADMFHHVGIEVQNPQGAFYLFPHFIKQSDNLRARGITNSVELCERLLAETGVAVLPGCEFGQSRDELTVRIAYVNFDGAQTLKASYKIPLDQPLNGEFLKTYCGDTITAVERLIDWVIA